MAPPETLLKTAKAYLASLENVDGPGLEAVTTEDMTATIAPASAGVGTSATRADLVARFTGFTDIMSEFHINIKQTWINEAANQVTVWTDGSSTFKPEIIGDDDPADWAYKGENIFLFSLNKSGEKITHLLEWCDSKGVEKMLGLFAKAWERVQAAKSSS